METILLQTQTRGAAAAEIIIMLIIAGLIGFLTAYFYYRNKFGLIRDQLNGFQENLREYDDENKKLKSDNELLQKKYEATKALHKEAISEIDDMSHKAKTLEHELKEKDDVLVRIAQRKHLLNYENFGRATAADKDNLKMISGIGPFIESKLHALDIYTFKQIGKFTRQDIQIVNEAIEFFPGRIERDNWVDQAKDLLSGFGKQSEMLDKVKDRKHLINYNRIGVASIEQADDLTIIGGIGGWIQEKLNALDIFTFRQIANFTKEDEEAVSNAIEFFPGRIHRDEWVPQAQELLYSKGEKTDILERIKSRKHKIDFASIGLAHEDDAQDLTKIKGIGEFIEKKLNTLGIYTYDQIGRFTEKDVKTVTEIIEFFPGRIERDGWIGQARALSSRKVSDKL